MESDLPDAIRDGLNDWLKTSEAEKTFASFGLDLAEIIGQRPPTQVRERVLPYRAKNGGENR